MSRIYKKMPADRHYSEKEKEIKSFLKVEEYFHSTSEEGAAQFPATALSSLFGDR